MTQALCSQLVPIASMGVYRRQNDAEQLQSHLPSTKRSRNRGVILSRQGWQKLMRAEILCNEFGERYTYEQLSDRSHLDERTISRLLSCEVRVDKRTLKTFFNAFNLTLETGDYTLSNNDKTSTVTSESSIYTDAMNLSIQVEQLVEELNRLKQRMRECEHLFHRLGLNENYVSQQLKA